jgi:hypothetical protein
LAKAATELRAIGVEVIEVSAHLATKETIDDLWQQVIALARSVDVACLNAGV